MYTPSFKLSLNVFKPSRCYRLTNYLTALCHALCTTVCSYLFMQGAQKRDYFYARVGSTSPKQQSHVADCNSPKPRRSKEKGIWRVNFSFYIRLDWSLSRRLRLFYSTYVYCIRVYRRYLLCTVVLCWFSQQDVAYLLGFIIELVVSQNRIKVISDVKEEVKR